MGSDGPSVVEWIKPRERDSVVQPLRTGVVPRTGVQHIQVGRVNEVKQVMLDIDRIADQGSAVRFFIGDYGAGKTFFLNMARSMAVQRRLVAVHADLSADRRIHASGGHVRSFYADLMRNMATRTKPEGGALASVVESFVGEPTTRRRTKMRPRFDRIFHRRTGFATLDRLLERLHANKPELLMVLDHPEIQLHTNGSERDIRCHIVKRMISGGTHSDAGRDCRDAFLGLMQTCTKLGIAFWDYLGDRIGVAGQAQIPPLPDLIRCRGHPA